MARADEVVRRVSWLELFFDLIFVAAVAQVAAPLAHDFSPSAVGRFTVLFLLIWWAWLGQTTYATRFGREDAWDRGLTFAQICAAAVMAVNAQGALDSRDSAGFAAAFGLLRLLLVVQYARVTAPDVRPLTRRYQLGCAVSAALWLASAIVPPPTRYAAWLAAGLVDALTPLAAEAHGVRVPPHSEHLPERFGLFTIILLGEAMTSVMRGMQQHESWPPAAAISVFGGLFVVFQIWWWYFHAIGAAAPHHVRSQRQMRRLLSWTYAHVPLYVAMVLVGVGFEHLIVSANPVPDLATLTETLGAVLLLAAALALLRRLVARPGHRELTGQEPDLGMGAVAERLPG